MKKVVKSILKITTVLTSLNFINKTIKKSSDLSIVKDKVFTKDLFFESKHGKIRYIIEGKQSESKKSKVLLLHSLMIGGSLDEFKYLSNNLSFEFEVYKLDMLGFGHSDKPDISYNAYLYSSIINDFIDKIINDNVTVIASGASADFAFMARELNDKKIENLVLINPLGFSNTSFYGSVHTKVMKNIINLPIIGTSIANVMSSRIAIKKNLLDRCIYNPNLVTKELVNEFYYNAHYNCENNKHSLAHLFTNFLKTDIKSKIIKTEKITSIILGENCNDFDCYRIKKKIDKNENINLTIIPLSSELVAREKANELSKVIITSI